MSIEKKLGDLLARISFQTESAPEVLETQVSGIVYDSRQAGPGRVFVCLRGARADGHAYAKAAGERGHCRE